MAYTVKKVSDIAGISVRALHHYDAIGLLKPESLSPAGYRLYSDSDLEKLQQVLFFRELGFGLSEITKILGSDRYDREEALRQHRKLMIEKKKRLERIIASVEKTLENFKGGKSMKADEMFGAFDESTVERYKEEVRAKYPKKTVEESERRTSGYTKEDWKKIDGTMKEIFAEVAALADREPSDPEVRKAVGDYHRMINERFYECTPEMYRGLGSLYVCDERFTAYFDRIKPGLAGYVKKAIDAYCDWLESDSD